MSEHQPAKILLVDDEPFVLSALTRILKKYRVVTALNAKDGLILAGQQPFDLVISDYHMPVMDGIDFLDYFMRLQPDAIRIMLTGFANLNNAQAAINKVEVFRFINKPWNNDELLDAVHRGLEHKRILEENRRLADLVREQQKELDEKNAIINALEAEEPGITKVNWSEDGAIVLDEEDLKDFD